MADFLMKDKVDMTKIDITKMSESERAEVMDIHDRHTVQPRIHFSLWKRGNKASYRFFYTNP